MFFFISNIYCLYFSCKHGFENQTMRFNIPYWSPSPACNNKREHMKVMNLIVGDGLYCCHLTAVNKSIHMYVHCTCTITVYCIQWWLMNIIVLIKVPLRVTRYFWKMWPYFLLFHILIFRKSKKKQNLLLLAFVFLILSVFQISVPWRKHLHMKECKYKMNSNLNVRSFFFSKFSSGHKKFGYNRLSFWSTL